MPVNLFDYECLDEIARRLRDRAGRHHRLLDEEPLAIIKAVGEVDRLRTPADLLAAIRRLGLTTGGEVASVWIGMAVKIVDSSALRA